MTNCRLCGETIEHEEHEQMEICHDCLHDGFNKLKKTIATMDDIDTESK